MDRWLLVLLWSVGLLAAETALAEPLLALLPGSVLLRVDTADPSIILASVNITGLQPAETLLAIDGRPSTGQLYGLGNTSRLYVINPVTGVSAQVGNGQFSPLLSGNSFGFDFNPVTDQIRVVSDLAQNIRLDPDTGIATTDAPLHGMVGGSLINSATGAAYSSNTSDAVSTTLYVIDSTSDALYMQGSTGGSPSSPNDGVLTLVGALNSDVSGFLGFDISPSGTPYVTAKVNGSSSLYSINLGTGALTQLGSFPSSIATVAGLALGVTAGCSLDVDGNGAIDPLTDGLLLFRAMFGLTGTAATVGATGIGATRASWQKVRAYMNGNCGTDFAP
jgi:hypothetical protein